MSKFDGINWTIYSKSDGLVHQNVWSIAVDRNGNKWFGTGGGVSMLVDTIVGIIDENNICPHSKYNFFILTSGKNIVVNFKNKSPGSFTLALYNLQGKCIHSIFEKRVAGKQTIKLKTASISSGSYICRIKTSDGISACKKVMIMR